MCKAKSFICVKRKDTPLWSDKHDSHSQLIKEHQLHDGELFTRTFVKVELFPKNGNWFSPGKEWEFVIDEQGTLPGWFEDDKQLWHDRCWAVIKDTVLPLIKKGIFPGDLSIDSNVPLTAPQLKTVGGDLFIDSNGTLPKLQTVGGDLHIYSKATLPKLQTVGGDLSIYNNATFTAPKLQTVRWYLSIDSNATLPELKTVGGDLHISSNATLTAPKLKTVAGQNVQS